MRWRLNWEEEQRAAATTATYGSPTSLPAQPRMGHETWACFNFNSLGFLICKMGLTCLPQRAAVMTTAVGA